MSYDPDPGRRRRSRRGRVPPQLRAWVFGRRRTHDPRRKSIRYGYGAVKGKPYGVGRRGGVYWSRGKKPRYDPGIRSRLRGYGKRIGGYGRRIGGKFEGFINKYGTYIGGGLAALSGIWGAINTYNGAYGKKAMDNYVATIIGGKIYAEDGVTVVDERKPEIMNILGDAKRGITPQGYLGYKFLGMNLDGSGVPFQNDSAWIAPFWLSLIGFILSKIPLPIRSWARIRRPLGKIAAPALVVSTIGALALPGCPNGTQPSTSSFARTSSNISFNVPVHN